MNQLSNYQGVRMMNHAKDGLSRVNYPGVRSKGSPIKVVRKVSTQGKVYQVFSWSADIPEEQLAQEQKKKTHK
jgi:hypothetical protein